MVVSVSMGLFEELSSFQTDTKCSGAGLTIVLPAALSIQARALLRYLPFGPIETPQPRLEWRARRP